MNEPHRSHKIVVVLLSGGIDSTVAATIKAREADNLVHLLSIFYGQGAEEAERSQSRLVGDWLLSTFDNVVEHFEIFIGGNTRASKSKLRRIGSSMDLRTVSLGGFVGWRQPAQGWPLAGYPSTRDEVFALIAAAGAEARLRDFEFAREAEVVLATNKDDIDNFPDIRAENYLLKLNSILAEKLIPQTGRPLKIDLPLIDLTKEQVVRAGKAVGAPLHLTWSCYFGEPESPCGSCDQCRWRSAAFRAAGIEDPTLLPAEHSKSVA